MKVEKTTITWFCDWCHWRVVTDDGDKHPPGWIDGTDSDVPGIDYCSADHLLLAKDAWEVSQEAGLDGAHERFEEEQAKRQNWRL